MQSGDESLEALRAGIDRLAAQESAGILAEATVQARERVRSMLTEAIALSMLDRTRELLDRPNRPQPSVPPQPSASVTPQPDAGELGWYIYGVVASEPQSAEPDAPGIDTRHPVGSLAEGALAAVTSRVALEEFGEEQLREHLADMDWLERTARAHERVLDAARAQTTVIPMRLCTVYRSEQGVREMLLREQEGLHDALEYLEHKAEWGVKVIAASAPEPKEATGADPTREPLSGAAYMQRRHDERGRQAARSQRIEQACEQIHDQLCAVAADGRLASPQRPEVSGYDAEMVLNASYLVDDTERDEFHRRAQTLQSEFSPVGLALELTGPWPAYNFVPGTIGAAW